MDKIVLIGNGTSYKLNTLQEIVEILIGEQYYNLSKEEQTTVLRQIAFENETINQFEQGSINIQDEITYILSLLKLNLITVMESKDADILGRYMDKNLIDGNYIILNAFADRLLEGYLAVKK